MTKIEVGSVYGGREVWSITRQILATDGADTWSRLRIKHAPEGNDGYAADVEWDSYDDFVERYVNE